MYLTLLLNVFILFLQSSWCYVSLASCYLCYGQWWTAVPVSGHNQWKVQDSCGWHTPVWTVCRWITKIKWKVLTIAEIMIESLMNTQVWQENLTRGEYFGQGQDFLILHKFTRGGFFFSNYNFWKTGNECVFKWTIWGHKHFLILMWRECEIIPHHSCTACYGRIIRLSYWLHFNRNHGHDVWPERAGRHDVYRNFAGLYPRSC